MMHCLYRLSGTGIFNEEVKIMLTLLFGTDWKYNRHTIMQMLSADVAAEKAGCILMVPELTSHQAERELARYAGDTASRFAEVLSFSRLAK